MTHFFYRKRRELPPKSPLLPLIHAEQSKQEKYAAMLKSGVPPHAVFGITEPSKVVKLPHELEEGYKEYHDRPLYMRLFRNYEEQHEENKKWDELSFDRVVILNDKKTKIQLLIKLLDLIKTNKIINVSFSDDKEKI